MDTNYDFPVQLQPIYQGNDYKLIPNRKAVVRTDTMDTLGIVSDNYGLVKHKTVVDSFREAGKAFNVQEKIGLLKDGSSLFYTMTFPKVEAEVKKGDIVRMMLIAKNSYNGGHSLQIVFGAFRLVCSNGMILGTQFLQFSYRHIGNVYGFENTISPQPIIESYEKYIKLFGEKMPMITQMARKELPMVHDRFFEKGAVRLPDYLREEAYHSFLTGQDQTVWGYYNALTYAITHKMRRENPARAIVYGMEAWKAADRLMA